VQTINLVSEGIVQYRGIVPLISTYLRWSFIQQNQQCLQNKIWETWTNGGVV